MRVLILHNRYRHRGGEDVCFESERDLLREAGHFVGEYVVDNSSLKPGDERLAGLRAVWNAREYQRVRNAIQSVSPEVLHVHNTFPLLSPAVYYAASAEGVPVVQTLHNYRLLCPGAMLFRDGAPCEDCINSPTKWRAVLHGCYRNSRSASAAVAAMASVHNALRTWSRMVSAYIVLTDFARAMFERGGIPPEKMYVKPNFCTDPGEGAGDGKYALYVGRLAPEKGIGVLLHAWSLIRAPIQLKIAGAGPLEGMVREAARRSPYIQYLGISSASEVRVLMKRAFIVVVPSLAYERPRTVFESFAAGTPVIASRGLMESLVNDGENGVLFRPGDSKELALKIGALAHDPVVLKKMRQNARAEYLQKYTPERNYELLMNIYRRVTAGNVQLDASAGTA